MKPKRKVFRILPAGLLMVLFLFLAGCSGSSQLLLDGPVPGFKLQDINGRTVALQDYEGKAVLLHFWDTTFDACTNELPYLQTLHEEWTQSGKAVLLTIDATETAETLKTFMQSHNYTFPVLLDSGIKVAGKYNITLVPASILISKEGKLKLSVVGPFKDKSAIDKQLAPFLP